MRCIGLLFIIWVAAEALPDKRPLLRRGGRQQLETGYGAPAPAAEGYGAPDYEEPEVLDVRSEELSSYNEERSLDTYGDNDALASELDAKSADPGLDMLMKAIPGIPGEDYPILSSAPETAFSCDGQVNGGYYADPEAECQAFHVCGDNGSGGMTKYTFLCPNGTIFNQETFICDWWFNFDCSEAEALAESRNAEILSEREAAEARLAEESAAPDAYGAPAEERLAEESAPVSSYGAAPEDREAAGGYGAPLETYEGDYQY